MYRGVWRLRIGSAGGGGGRGPGEVAGVDVVAFDHSAVATMSRWMKQGQKKKLCDPREPIDALRMQSRLDHSRISSGKYNPLHSAPHPTSFNKTSISPPYSHSLAR